MADDPRPAAAGRDSQDWLPRLDALSDRLVAMESQLRGLREDLVQLQGEARQRAAFEQLVSATQPPAEPPPSPISPPELPEPSAAPLHTSPPAKPTPEAEMPFTPPSPAAQPLVPPTTPPTAPPVRRATEKPIDRVPAPPPASVDEPASTSAFPGAGAVVTPPPKPAPKDAAAAAPVPRGGISNLEAKIGGAWLSRLGAAALLIGAAFVFKIAADQGLVTPWMRVTGGWIAALALLGLGEWTARRQMPWFAASVTGAGLGLGYIASYSASPQFYGLLSLSASYGAFSVVTALGLLQAVRLAQLTTAIFALVGGYLTLVVLRSAHPTAAGLLGYLIALNLGALGAGQLRRWPILRYLTWPGTAAMTGLYLAMNHRPGTELAVCLSLLPLLFALFQLDIFLWRLRKPSESPLAASALSGLNCSALLVALYIVVLDEQVALIVGTAFFLVAAFQVVLARALWVLSDSEPNRHMSIGFYGQASAAAALGFPVAFDRSAIVLGWSAQALTIAWLVRHVHSIVLRVKVPLLLAGGIGYIAYYFASDQAMLAGPEFAGLHLVLRMWLAAAVALAGAAAAWLFARWYTRSAWFVERATGEACAALAAVAGVIAGATLLALVPDMTHWVWMTLAAASVLGLLSYTAKVLRLPALMMLALAAAIVLVISDMPAAFRTVFGPQPWTVGPLTLGVLLPTGLALALLAFWNAWLFRHSPTTRDLSGDMGEWVAGVATVATCLVLRHQLADDNAAYAVIGGLLAALALTLAARRWPAPAYGAWSAVTWSIAAVYWVLAATIGERYGDLYQVSAAWTAATPLLNATFFSGLGLVLVAWPIVAHLRTIPLLANHGTRALRTVPLVLAAYIVVHAISCEVDRWFQIHGAAWFSRPAYIESTTLTAVWMLLAVAYLAIGLRDSLRPLRIFGLVVLTVAAVKLLAWDTTFPRIMADATSPWFWTTMYPLANPTFAAVLLLLAGVAIQWRALRRSGGPTPDKHEMAQVWLIALPAYALLHVFSFEVDRWFQIHGAANFEHPEYVESMTLSAVWAGFALLYLLTSLRFAWQSLWSLALGVATVATIKIAVADTIIRRFGDDSRLLETWGSIPGFANPTLICGVLLAAVAFAALAGLRRSTWLNEDQRTLLDSALPTLAAYLLVHVLSFELDRWFQAGGSARFADPAHAERVGLSVLWACCALGCVVGGLTFSVRPLRLFGLFVFALTAGKVLLRDMAHVATIYRALSAMGLGILALAGSFAYQRVRRVTAEQQEPPIGQS